MNISVENKWDFQRKYLQTIFNFYLYQLDLPKIYVAQNGMLCIGNGDWRCIKGNPF